MSYEKRDFPIVLGEISISEKIHCPSSNKSNKTNNEQHPTVTELHATTATKHTTPLLLLPKTIPPAPITYPTPTANKYCTPITVRIHKPKHQTGHFDKHRILLSILHAIQMADPSANIAPSPQHDYSNDFEHFTESDIIHHSEHIPKNGIDLDRYFEFPSTTRVDRFNARLILNSDLDFHAFKRNQNIIAWLHRENIQLDRSPLESTIQPQQIGFFTHMIARTDQTTLYEARIQQNTSMDCPHFFLQIKYIRIGSVSTKVWNVYSNKDDHDTIKHELKRAYNSPQLRQFYAWDEFQSLQPGQQMSIIQRQNAFNMELRSLIIDGFNTNINTTNIQWHDESHSTSNPDRELILMTQDNEMIDDPPNKPTFATTPIAEYIHKTYISGDGMPIFEHVYHPCEGKCEVLVKHTHIPEALSIIKVITIELCRAMPPNIAHNVFPDATTLIEAGHTSTAWKPFDIQQQIQPTSTAAVTDHSSSSHGTKRLRRQKYNQCTYTKAVQNLRSLPLSETNINYNRSPEPTVASTLTNGSTTSPPQTRCAIGNKSSSFEQGVITSLQEDIRTLTNTITTIEERVTNNQQLNEQSIQHLNTTHKENFETLTKDNKSQMTAISVSIFDQMRQNQVEIHQTLSQLFIQRENALEQKLNTNLDMIMAKIHGSTHSPVRKKSTTQHDTSTMQTEDDTPCTNSDSPSHINISTINSTNYSTEHFNPYNKTSLRRRSVTESPPTEKP
jgi:hypothetical protein